MDIELGTPDVAGLMRVLDALRSWQDDGAPWQLHPGDVGWACTAGVEAAAAAVRTWSRDGRVLAVGLQDGPALLRMTMAPDAFGDEELGQRLVEDLSDPGRGVLPDGSVDLEAPVGALVHDLLAERGWVDGEPWQPLRRDLTDPVEDPGVRVVVVRPEDALAVEDRVAVQRASFDGSRFSTERWHAVAAGPAYDDARCLVAHDEQGAAVAMVTVWSAGPGRPGLIEPLGVHRDHRGRGHGRAITLAAMATLRELGSSSAVVYTPSANVGGVATYAAAGMTPQVEVRDRHREGSAPAGPDPDLLT